MTPEEFDHVLVRAERANDILAARQMIEYVSERINDPVYRYTEEDLRARQIHLETLENSEISFDDDAIASAWTELKYGTFREAVCAEFRIRLAADYGGEGMGEEFWAVAEHTDDEGNRRFFRRDGFYRSYAYDNEEFLDGTTYEVHPRRVEVTQFERV